jgi:hypothetical protein
MTPSELWQARQDLDLSISEMAAALRLSPENGPRKVRRMEAGEADISGPIAVAVEAMLKGFCSDLPEGVRE